MKKLNYILAMIFLLALAACTQPTRIIPDTDLTYEITGTYQGNYIVNFESDSAKDISSQIELKVERIDNDHIRVLAEGGDSFECTVTGSSSSKVDLNDMTATTGAYVHGEHLEGNYYDNRLYYKITGTYNGGAFKAEFTSLK